MRANSKRKVVKKIAEAKATSSNTKNLSSSAPPSITRVSEASRGVLSSLSSRTNGVLSRGQAKRLMKKDRLERRHNFVCYMEKLKEQELQRKEFGALADFDKLTSALSSIKNSVDQSCTTLTAQPEKRISSSKLPYKKKTKVLSKEFQNYQAILSLTQFQENPVKAIQKHLANTLNNGEIPPQ